MPSEYYWFPDIIYDKIKMKDISRRFTIKYIEQKNTRPFYYKYEIQGWKSIENVAYDIYGSCDYIWAIMIANNIVDPVNDWIKPEDEIFEDAIVKYGGKEQLHSTHHYECNGIKFTTKYKTIYDSRKIVLKYTDVPKDVYEAITKAFPEEIIKDIKVISNIEYELSENEKKRIINVIYPELMNYIEEQVKKLF